MAEPNNVVEYEQVGEQPPPRPSIVWFTIPYLSVKLLQLQILSLPIGSQCNITIILMFLWKSADINVANLVTMGATQGFDSYRSEVYCFIGLSVLSVVYSVIMVLIGLCRVKLRAFAITLLPSIGFFLWLFAAPFMSYVVRELQNSLWARQINLDTNYLSVATGLGFGLMILFVLDSFLGFVHLQAGEEAKRTGVEPILPAAANKNLED
eukprot:Em0005g1260a